MMLRSRTNPEIIEYLYNRGYCTLEKLQEFLAVDILTEEQFKNIVRESIKAKVESGEITEEKYKEIMLGEEYIKS